MDKQLAELIKMSNTVGQDTSLVQGGGGNTSVKTDDGQYMYIKASGTALKDMNAKRGWRRLSTAAVLDIFADKSLPKMDVNSRELEVVDRLLLTCDDDIVGQIRPSVESPMHVVLDKCVIHLHAIAAQAYTSAKNGQSEALMLFKDEPFPPLWVPYANPGFELGHKVFRLVDSYVKKHGRKPAVLFMQKHGVLVASQSADGALELVHKVINLCRAGLDQSEHASGLSASKQQIEQCEHNIAKALLENTGRKTKVSFSINPTIEQFLAANSPWQMLRAGPLTPDELAYVDSSIVWLKDCKYQTVAEKVAIALSKNQQAPPKSFIVKNVGLFVAAEHPLALVIRDVVVASLFIRRHAHNMGGINALSPGQRNFIENWEAEKFRVQLAATGP